MFFKPQLDVCTVEDHYGSHIVLYIPPTLKYEAYALVLFGASFYCRDKNCRLLGLWIRVAYASANISAVLDILSVFVVVQLSLKMMDICILYTVISIVRHYNITTIIVQVKMYRTWIDKM